MSTELGTALINAYCKGGFEGVRNAERILQPMLVRLSTPCCQAPAMLVSADQSAGLTGKDCGSGDGVSERSDIQLNACGTPAAGFGQLWRISCPATGASRPASDNDGSYVQLKAVRPAFDPASCESVAQRAMADAAVQPNAATFHLLTRIYEESGMEVQLEELVQLQKTMAVLRGTR